MEKQPNPECDSMTTVTVKDYASGMEYPDPPPSYRGVSKQHPMVQVARIIAMTTITIAAMISVAIVVSAWLTSNNNGGAICQYPQTPGSGERSAGSIETIVLGPQPQSLKGALLVGSSDLDPSESKIESSTNKATLAAAAKKDASSDDDNDEDDEDVEGSSEEDGNGSVTMLKLPLELNLQEHMFEKLNHRSHMNCVIEKKKAEEIVDEQAKPLPPFLGINMSTDPRYLHFTGEKMIVSCGGDDPKTHKQSSNSVPVFMPAQQHQEQQGFPPQLQQLHPILMELLHGGPPPSPMLFPPPANHPLFGAPQQQQPVQEQRFPFLPQSPPAPAAPSASASSPRIHMIGPIPISTGQNPFETLLQQVVAESQVEPIFGSANSRGGNRNNGPEPIFVPNNDLDDDLPDSSGPIFFHQQQPSPQQGGAIPRNPAQGRSIQFQLPGSFLTQGEVIDDDSLEQQQQIPARAVISELLQRERALPHPVPIQPRHHIQQVIRPRRSTPVEEKAPETKIRVKRCSCDCACKNHNPLQK